MLGLWLRLESGLGLRAPKSKYPVPVVENARRLKSHCSTCHERTPSGPDKSVRTLQVAARHRDGRGTPNITHLAILHNTITTSDCHNHQTTARKFERSVGRKFGCAPVIFG